MSSTPTKSPVPNTTRRSAQSTKSSMSWTQRMWWTNRWPTSSTATSTRLRRSSIRLMWRLRCLISTKTKRNHRSILWFKDKGTRISHRRRVRKRRKESTQVRDQRWVSMGRRCFSRLKRLTLERWSRIPRSTGLLFFTTPIPSRGCFIWSTKRRPWYGTSLPFPQ